MPYINISGILYFFQIWYYLRGQKPGKKEKRKENFEVETETIAEKGRLGATCEPNVNVGPRVGQT